MRIGSHHSLKTKKRLSETHSGKNNYWYGKRLSEEHKRKMSLATKRQMTPEFRKKMSDNRKGDKHPSWKGGKNYSSNTYIRIFMPEHPNARQNYVLEHRVVMEKRIGRYLKPEEVVHHINEVKTDNRLANLWLYKNSAEHLESHRELRKAKAKFLERAFDIACRGGSFFEVLDVTNDKKFCGTVELYTPEEMGYCIDEMTGELLYVPEEMPEKNGAVENAKEDGAK